MQTENEDCFSSDTWQYVIYVTVKDFLWNLVAHYRRIPYLQCTIARNWLLSSIAASPAWNAGLTGTTPHFLGTLMGEHAWAWESFSSQNLDHLQYKCSRAPFLEMLRKLFRPVKPFLVHLYPKTEKFMCQNFVYDWRKPLLISRICDKTAL